MTNSSAACATVDATELVAWQSVSGTAPLVIDVRSAAEFDTVHVRGAYHVPLATLGEHTRELAGHLAHDERVVLVCQSGVRAEQGRRHLATVGLDHAQVLDGGVTAYEQAGGEVVRGRRAWALERQVRLVAGALVVTGLAAGRLLSPKARLLAGAIGTGLTVSALTDTCAMGAALARMPWNRDHSDPEPADTLDRLARRTRAA